MQISSLAKSEASKTKQNANKKLQASVSLTPSQSTLLALRIPSAEPRQRNVKHQNQKTSVRMLPPHHLSRSSPVVAGVVGVIPDEDRSTKSTRLDTYPGKN